MALLRRVPPNLSYAAVTEADFSNCSLSVIDLSVLPSLVKLSLANNSIREQQLERTFFLPLHPSFTTIAPSSHSLGSNITSLNDLRLLDLRNNQLKALGHVCDVLGRIPRLENLWLEGNPCFQNNAPNSRVRFFKKVSLLFLYLSLFFSHISSLLYLFLSSSLMVVVKRRCGEVIY
jgi:Leucine-rich repeat (LRR) protein